jgi:hypothetical protein
LVKRITMPLEDSSFGRKLIPPIDPSMNLKTLSELVVWWANSGGNVKIVCRSQTVNVKAKRGKNWKGATLFTYPLIFS